jgi:hypothetical protein
MRFPLRYAHENILLGPSGQAAALYRLGMVSYPFLAVSGKWALQARLERLGQMIAADFSLWRVYRAYPAETFVAHTVGLLDERHQDPWRGGSFSRAIGSGLLSLARMSPSAIWR